MDPASTAELQNVLASSGLSRMSIKILPPANMRERMARHRGLIALRQDGSEVGFFAQFFWTMSVGLDYNDAALKDIFNSCLDDPLPAGEMDSLSILDFWGFSMYLVNRSKWGMPSRPESACCNHPALHHLTRQVYDPPLASTKKLRSREKRAVQSITATPESVKLTTIFSQASSPSAAAEKAVPAPTSVNSVPEPAAERAVSEPASVEAVSEAVTESAVSELASEEAVPESATESAVSEPASKEAVSEPASKEAVPESATESAVSEPASESAVPESAVPESAAHEGDPESVPLHATATQEGAPESVPLPVSKTFTDPTSSVFAPMSVKPSWKPRSVRPVPVSKSASYQVPIPPIPPSAFPGYGSPKPAPPLSALNFFPGSVPTRPIPPSVFPGHSLIDDYNRQTSGDRLEFSSSSSSLASALDLFISLILSCEFVLPPKDSHLKGFFTVLCNENKWALQSVAISSLLMWKVHLLHMLQPELAWEQNKKLSKKNDHNMSTGLSVNVKSQNLD
ncbi:hypothetical protein PO909_030523 [Leuciscus waleckii]